MSKKLKRKVTAVILVEILCVVLFGAFLMKMQNGLAVDDQKVNTEEKLSEMQAVIEKADAAAQQNELSFDEVYQSKAASIAFMANKDHDFDWTDAGMKELALMMDVTNVLILDSEGKKLSSAEKSPADFTHHRFNQLRTVFETGETSAAFDVNYSDVSRRYYGAKIDEDREAVIEQDPAELRELQEDTSSWRSILSNIKVGLSGFTFAVSNQDYTFLYYPETEMVGKDSLDAGLDVKALSDGNFDWMTVDGRRFYCGVKNIPSEDAFIICAVPETEMVSSRNITVGVVLFIFFVIMTVVAVYAVLTLKEQEEQSAAKGGKPIAKGYNAAVGRKILTFSTVGVIFILIVSFYMQTLFSLSLRSMSNTHQAEEVGATLAENEEEVALVKAQYNKRYLNKCQIASYILGRNPKLHNKEDLAELSKVLGVEFLLIFDKNGKEVVSDSSYINFRLSEDPEEQSYGFRPLLNGLDYVIQDAQPDEVSGRYRQYIGVTLKDKNGDADGFVQMAVVPEKLEAALKTTSLSSVLGNVKASAGGFTFAVDKETHNFVYYPSDRINGKNAEEYGMKENQFRDGYCDYITIDSQKYFASSLETENNYIYVAVPQNKLAGTRIPVAAASGVASLIGLLLIFFILAFNSGTDEKGGTEAGQHNGPMVDVVMPDGSIRKSESAADRWKNNFILWSDKTPEQKVGALLKGLMAVFALIICIAIIFKDKVMGGDSIFMYILNGKWERSLNIFAFTGCIMIICVAGVAVMLLQSMLKMLAKSLGARGATICRLLHSFVKYVSVIAILYYCFALFGVDTKTLLASAGILSLVIGLGAKELVSDILAGLFIIFEGEFQVGDIVTIGDWKGTVQEIGVRTTKIMDAGENVKVISNSSVSGVINMTKRISYCACDVGIEYGESLERVEFILAKELPKMKARFSSIVDGPFYKGVVSLGDNSVNIRIVAQCKEGDKAQLERDLNRQMKLLFDKYDVNIPFPQVVINQPKEYVEATEYQKKRADEFMESQKELAKDIKDSRE